MARKSKQINGTTAVIGIYPGVDLRYMVDNDLLKKIWFSITHQLGHGFISGTRVESRDIAEDGSVNGVC